MKQMFWNWIRWQSLNLEDWNAGEIPAGTIIDEEQALFQQLKIGIVKVHYARPVVPREPRYARIYHDGRSAEGIADDQVWRSNPCG